MAEQGGRSFWANPRKWAVTLVGWALVLLGIAALVLPGPGLLLLLVGLIVLSQEYTWAERRVEPVKKRAFEVAASSVATVPRIVMSSLGALGLIAVGVFWAADPRIGHVWIFGPELPAGGLATGSSLILSGVLALGLVVYSVRRFRDPDPADAEAVAAVSRDAVASD